MLLVQILERIAGRLGECVVDFEYLSFAGTECHRNWSEAKRCRKPLLAVSQSIFGLASGLQVIEGKEHARRLVDLYHLTRPVAVCTFPFELWCGTVSDVPRRFPFQVNRPICLRSLGSDPAHRRAGSLSSAEILG